MEKRQIRNNNSTASGRKAPETTKNSATRTDTGRTAQKTTRGKLPVGKARRSSSTEKIAFEKKTKYWKEQAIKKYQELKKKILKVSSEKWFEIAYWIILAYIILLAAGYARAIIWLKPKVLTNNIIINTLAAALPFGVWVFSTQYEKWGFHNIKKRWLYIIIGSGIATLIQPVLHLSWRIFVIKIMEIPVTENMTAGMVVFLGRVSLILPLVITAVIVSTPIVQFVSSTAMQEKIEDFKIINHVDMRKDKANKYDLTIVRDLKTGRVEPILEHDRFVHMFFNGQSGTGKTSSTIIPGVAQDLNTKIRNKVAREEALLEMLKGNRAYIAGPFVKATENNIRPRRGHEEEFKKIKERFPDCGMTIMAPNNDMINTIVKLCEARGIYVNVVDPAKQYSEKCARAKGIANFFIPPNISEYEKCIRILEQAENFSEVLVATNESKGEGDQYFRDINTSVTTNIAIVCMLAADINGTTTDINEINLCINDFSKLRDKLKIITDHYKIDVNTGTATNDRDPEDVRERLLKNKNKKGKIAEGIDNPYYTTILFVNNELLGKGAEKMTDQSRGLRNLINKILLDPRYRTILSKPVSECLDFDRMLERNEVTVVNTAIEFGSVKSTALGIMFLLNFQTAVLRRPMGTRSNHFLWVDEAAQYMHKVYENMYALYRQYRVSTCLAMQSTSQMDKNQSTSYLKSIILGAGTQILFGRASAEEMKLYEQLAGTAFVDSIQKTVTQTSMFATSSTQNESQRVLQEQKNILPGVKIRNRNFQEVTVFKIKNNRVQEAFLGKCSFLDKKELKKQEIKRVDFSKFEPVGKIKREPTLTKTAKKVVAEQKRIIKKASSATEITRINKDIPMIKTPIDDTLEVKVRMAERIKRENENKKNNEKKEICNENTTTSKQEKKIVNIIDTKEVATQSIVQKQDMEGKKGISDAMENKHTSPGDMTDKGYDKTNTDRSKQPPGSNSMTSDEAGGKKTILETKQTGHLEPAVGEPQETGQKEETVYSLWGDLFEETEEEQDFQRWVEETEN